MVPRRITHTRIHIRRCTRPRMLLGTVMQVRMRRITATGTATLLLVTTRRTTVIIAPTGGAIAVGDGDPGYPADIISATGWRDLMRGPWYIGAVDAGVGMKRMEHRAG